MDRHDASGQAVPEFGLLDLPDSLTQCDRVVLRHGPFIPCREDPIQIGARRPSKRCPFLFGYLRELLMELRYVAVSQKLLGTLHRVYPSQPQLLRQPQVPKRAPTGPAPAENAPQSFVLQAPSWHAPPGLDDACPPSLQPLPLRKSGFPDRCTTHRTIPGFRSSPATPPSLSAWIAPPLIAHSRSRWWHRPESRSDHASVHCPTTGVCSRRCAAACRATAFSPVFVDACPLGFLAISPAPCSAN